MSKSKKKQRYLALIMFAIIFLVFLSYCRISIRKINEENNIINIIKVNIEDAQKLIIKNKKLNEEDSLRINNYLEDADKNSKYYFIKGYVDYSNENYKEAVVNFKRAEKGLGVLNTSFVKIYNYFLLNKSKVKIDDNKGLINNARKVSKYIGESEEYKNNLSLIWSNIDTIAYVNKNNDDAIKILEEYLKNTNGLRDETIVKLTTDIGTLYRYDKRYADAMYHYLEAINITNKSKKLENKGFVRANILIDIANINYILNNYDDAIEYYKKSIDVDVKNKELNAACESLALINLAQSYIEIGKYDKGIEVANRVDSVVDDLAKCSKDDILSFKYNTLGLAYIYKHDPKKGKDYLDKSLSVISDNENCLSVEKDAFVDFSYGELYKEEKKYNKALTYLKRSLDKSIQNELGLELDIYSSMSVIYKNIGDFNNYDRVNSEYIKIMKANQDILTADYMKYTESLYEKSKNERIEYMHKIKVVLLCIAVIILIRITYSKAKNIKLLKKASFTDSMTGLNNRRYLDYYLENNKYDILNKDISVIILDIDYFKDYNDNYGHIKGDTAIKAVCEIIKNTIKKDEVAIRYGGEEMVIVLPFATCDEAVIISNEIKNKIREKNIEHKFSKAANILTVSIGIYFGKYIEGISIYDLVNKADKALYNAKRNGRNKIEVYEE